jgi:hypothetical protein
MLTVELNEREQRVEIFFDEDGLKTLRRSLDLLSSRGGHDHLMTPSWAGTELTEEKQGENTALINHLLLVFRDASRDHGGPRQRSGE